MSSAVMAALAPAREVRSDVVRGDVWGEAVAAFSRLLLLRGYSRFTVRDYSSDVFRLAKLVGGPPLGLRAEHVAEAACCDRSSGLAVQTQRRRASAYAMFHAWMRQDPALNGALPRLLAADSPLDLNERLLVALTGLAGLRLSEIRHLEGRDILLRTQVLRSRQGWRIVPLHPELLRLLEAHTAQRPLHSFRALVMGPCGYSVHERTLHGRFRRIAQRCEVSTLTPDLLRRTSAEKLRGIGTPQTLVRAFIGQERTQPLAPRSGQFADLSCIRDKIRQLL